MDQKMTVIFLVFGFGFVLTSHSHVTLHEYHYVDQEMTWTDAQHYCRVKYTDLATFENMDDINRLNRPGLETSLSWIGLTDDAKSWKESMGNDANSWRWSSTGETSRTGFQDWRHGSPSNDDANQLCGYVRKGTWDDWNCDHRIYAMCFKAANPQGQKNYILIKKWMSWMDAQAYCREHHTDLAMIENDQENMQVFSLIGTHFSAWIGLYRQSWRWSDNSSSSFTNWKDGEPDNSNFNQYCVTENSNHLWSDENCDNKFTFWCYGAPRVKKTIVKMKIQSDADLSDPDVNIQILNQMEAMLRSKGLTDFKLRWKIQPKKEEEEEDKDEDTCPVMP